MVRIRVMVSVRVRVRLWVRVRLRVRVTVRVSVSVRLRKNNMYEFHEMLLWETHMCFSEMIHCCWSYVKV